jgi:MurNAc alpha-1-phosphate uridylyltransferase
LLDHALDRLAEAGVERVVVNAFWHADRIEAHLAARNVAPVTVVRREDALLDTGGGVRAALDLLGPDPFYVVNGDAFWLDGPRPALFRLAGAHAAGAADDVLLVHRTCQVQAEVGLGDFAIDKWGAVSRRAEREVVPYVYAGVHLITPALLADTPQGVFSMNRVWDRAIAAGRLRAVVHDGAWFHLSTPSDLAQAEAVLAYR